jgi:hypothetical protein
MKKVILSLFLVSTLFAYTFPTAGGTDDFSSAFGARLLSGQYDFHSGVDIGNVNISDNVMALTQVWGNRILKNNNGEKEGILLEGMTDYYKYYHIDVDSYFYDCADSIRSAEEGDVIGTIKDIFPLPR